MKNIFFLFLFFVFNLQAQDIHLSQVMYSTQLLNPASYGNHEGWERFGVIQRNQSLSTGKYSTSLCYFDSPLMKPQSRGVKSHFGIGLQLFNDQSASLAVTNRSARLGFSSIVPISENAVISAGLEGGFSQISTDYSRLTFGSQFQGYDFNSKLANNEVTTGGINRIVPELGAGILFRHKNYKKAFLARRDTWYQFGVSAYHLLTNRNSNQVAEIWQPMKIVALVDFERVLKNDLVLNLRFNQYIQAKQNQTICSVILLKQMNAHSKNSNVIKPFRIGGGINYRLMDAVIPSFVMEWNEFIFMTSIDIKTNNMIQNKLGGIEFSIRYVRGNHSLLSKSLFSGGAKMSRSRAN